MPIVQKEKLIIKKEMVLIPCYAAGKKNGFITALKFI